MLAGATAHADPLPDSQNLDGEYLWLGPVGGAIRVGGAWDGAFGATAAWVHVREHRPLSLLGAAVEAARYSKRDGGRVAVEALAGTRAPGFLVGASVGAAVEFANLAHPRAGVTGAIWAFTGIEPYVRVGWFADSGSYVELGLAIALPLHHWRSR